MKLAILFFAILIPCSAGACHEPQAVSIVEQQDEIKAFAVSVSTLETYLLNSNDEIKANKKRYLVADKPPVKTSVALIVTEGDHKPWIVVRKVSGGRSVKLEPFEKNQFLFELSGNGEYEVTSLDANSEPVFSYFEIELDAPEEPQKPDDPLPPPGNYKDLIELATANINADLDTRKKLGAAWLAVVESNPASIEEAKKQIGTARINVLSFVKDQDGSWNKFLLAIDGWFKSKNLNRDQFLEAMKTLSVWMKE